MFVETRKYRLSAVNAAQLVRLRAEKFRNYPIRSFAPTKVIFLHGLRESSHVCRENFSSWFKMSNSRLHNIIILRVLASITRISLVLSGRFDLFNFLVEIVYTLHSTLDTRHSTVAVASFRTVPTTHYPLFEIRVLYRTRTFMYMCIHTRVLGTYSTIFATWSLFKFGVSYTDISCTTTEQEAFIIFWYASGAIPSCLPAY